ncbi:tetratricopeptide repeat protein [Bradyrhizobium japonicum]|uniref:tetratricopeptide repeat protein n=1 Tax=Bradyrhizobium japonicum TaxID=375 RepID=UPI001F0B1DE8|nr:tetratricopeptide repeat protein [Bradyrhizobium japonicum]
MGELDRAIADYDQIIELNPRGPSVYFYRGIVNARKDDHDRAVADYTQAMQLAHQDQRGSGDRKAQLQGQADDPAYASSADGQSIALASGDGIALRARGGAYAAKGDFDRAIADYDEAIRLNPRDKEAISARGNAYKTKGDFDRAIADYDQAAQLDARDARVYFHRARVYWQMASLAKSLTDLDQAIQLNPKNAYPVLWREIVARRSDQLSEAAKQLDATKWPAPIINLFLGTMTPEQVRSAADDADPVKKKGQVCEANFYVAERALQSGAKEEALKLFDLAAADCPKTFIEKQAADVELGLLRASR